MNERPLKVLLVEDDLDDLRLVEEALFELEDLQFSRTWLRACELHHVETVEEALARLRVKPADVILLDLSLPDGHGAGSFLRIQEKHRDVPVLLLADDIEEEQAISLVRQGAQDYLLKSMVDCLPLARCIRTALERHRVRSAVRSLSLIDDLTGLYSAGGFHRLGEQNFRLTRKYGLPLTVILFEIAGLDTLRSTYGAQERDLTVILASEALGNGTGDVDIAARLGAGRFALLAPRVVDIESLIGEVRRDVEATNSRRNGNCPVSINAGFASGLTVGGIDALVAAAEHSLCENRRSQTASTGTVN